MLKDFLKNIMKGISLSIGFFITCAVIGLAFALFAYQIEPDSIPTSDGAIFMGSEANPKDIEVELIGVRDGFQSTLGFKVNIKNLSEKVYENIYVQVNLSIDDKLVNFCSGTYYSAIEPMGDGLLRIQCRGVSGDALDLFDLEVKVLEAEYAITL